MTGKTAYIGRHRRLEGWRLQLVGFAYGEVSDIYAEIDIPDDTITLALADEFLYGIAEAKGLTIKARRRNDE